MANYQTNPRFAIRAAAAPTTAATTKRTQETGQPSAWANPALQTPDYQTNPRFAIRAAAAPTTAATTKRTQESGQPSATGAIVRQIPNNQTNPSFTAKDDDPTAATAAVTKRTQDTSHSPLDAATAQCEEFRDAFIETLHPTDEIERVAAETLAKLNWRLDHLRIFEAAVLIKKSEPKNEEQRQKESRGLALVRQHQQTLQDNIKLFLAIYRDLERSRIPKRRLAQKNSGMKKP